MTKDDLNCIFQVLEPSIVRSNQKKQEKKKDLSKILHCHENSLKNKPAREA
jgi:hypothetical protein